MNQKQKSDEKKGVGRIFIFDSFIPIYNICWNIVLYI